MGSFRALISGTRLDRCQCLFDTWTINRTPFVEVSGMHLFLFTAIFGATPSHEQSKRQTELEKVLQAPILHMHEAIEDSELDGVDRALAIYQGIDLLDTGEKIQYFRGA